MYFKPGCTAHKPADPHHATMCCDLCTLTVVGDAVRRTQNFQGKGWSHVAQEELGLAHHIQERARLVKEGLVSAAEEDERPLLSRLL